MKQTIATASDVSTTLTRLAHDLQSACPRPTHLALIGIQRRGAQLAQRIAARIAHETGASVPLGVLDITFYRDDLSMVAQQPIVRSTSIPFTLDDKEIVLVDDVLYTGRTIRAALDALVDFGRPRVVRLLVLVDRGLRELPIQPDFVGWTVATKPGDMIKVQVTEIDGVDGIDLVTNGA